VCSELGLQLERNFLPRNVICKSTFSPLKTFEAQVVSNLSVQRLSFTAINRPSIADRVLPIRQTQWMISIPICVLLMKTFISIRQLTFFLYSFVGFLSFLIYLIYCQLGSKSVQLRSKTDVALRKTPPCFSQNAHLFFRLFCIVI